MGQFSGLERQTGTKRFFIRKGMATGGKIATAVAILFAVALLWGTFTHILVNESIFAYDWPDAVAVIVTLLLMYLLYRSRERFRTNMQMRGKSVVAGVLALLIAIPVLTKLFCERSIPVILHTLVGEPSKMEVVVKGKISQKRCRSGVELMGYEHILNGRVCGLNSEFLSFAERGTRFTVIGQASPFGFTVDQYRYQLPSAHAESDPR